MSRRASNPRLVKIHRSYSVEEAARLLDVHKHTVREWIRVGLPTIDQHRPTLVLGSALADFIVRRRRSKKRPCQPGQIYCVRCREPQHPAGDVADYIPITRTRGNLVGICPICDALIHRGVSLAKLDAVRGNLEVTFPEAVLHIVEGGAPSVKPDFEQE